VQANSGANTDWCNPLVLIEVNDFDSMLQNQILPALKGPAGVTPTTLPIFLLSNVAMYDRNAPGFNSTNPLAQGGCCILGYHNAYLSLTTGTTAGKLQTYIVANYDSTASTVNGVIYTGASPAGCAGIFLDYLAEAEKEAAPPEPARVAVADGPWRHKAARGYLGRAPEVALVPGRTLDRSICT
jgi:hypothetical protein